MADDRLSVLRETRDDLIRRRDGADDRNVAGIVNQLRAVLSEIAECEKAAPSKETPLDELRAKRAARSASGKADAASTKPRRRG